MSAKRKPQINLSVNDEEKIEIQSLADKFARGNITAFIFKAIEYFKQNNKVD